MSSLPSESLLEQMSDSVGVYETDGTVVFVNATTEQIFGKPRRELVGKNLWQVFPGAVGNVFHRRFQEVAATGTAASFEHLYRPWGRCYHNAMYLVDGRVFVIARDITVEKRTNDALVALADLSLDVKEAAQRAAERVAREFADLCVIALVEGDALVPWAIHHTNPLAGRELAEMWLAAPLRLGEGLSGHVAATGAPVFAPQIDPVDLARRLKPAHAPFLAHAPRSGMIVPLRERRAPRAIFGTISVARYEAAPRFTSEDFTAFEELAHRVAAAIENALLHERTRAAHARTERVLALGRRLEDVTRAMSHAMSADEMTRVATDAATGALGADSVALYFLTADGSALERVFDVGLKDGARRNYDRVPLELDAPLVQAVKDRRPIWIEGQQQLAATYPRSAERLRDAGIAGPLSMACAPLVADDQVFGAIAFTFYQDRAFDEADRHFVVLLADHSSLALSRARQFDEQRRTAEEARAAYEHAQIAERRKDEFLAMLGHELRNPLAPMRTALHLLAQRHDDVGTRERRIIERQVLHLERLVGDLMDVSRITRGKIELERVPLDGRDVVTKAIEMASPLFEEKQQRVDVQLPAEPLPLEGDEARLAQVLANLLTNAAKYTGAGGVIQVIAAREGDHVVFRVRDTGAGISPDLLPHIFERFIQGPQTLARSQGGLGLGLAIVKSLTELHGGQVTARSPGEGLGSELEVRLPVGAIAPATADEIRAPAVDTSALRILVVDDNQDAADMLAEALALYGHVVRVAYDGPAALELLREHDLDVVLLDLGLPVMDGFEVAERLRAGPRGAHLRLVAVTGYGQEKDRDRAARAGFDAHLVKPVDLDELLAVMTQQRTVLQRRRS